MIDSLIASRRGRLESLYSNPQNGAFQETMLPVWRSTFVLERPREGEVIAELGSHVRGKNYHKREVALGRLGKGDRIAALLLSPEDTDDDSWVFILAHSDGRAAFLDESGAPIGLAKRMIEEGKRVLLPDLYETGGTAGLKEDGIDDYFQNHFTAYNRTELQERVQDMVTSAAFCVERLNATGVALVGVGRAGLWTLLAAPAVDAVLADCDGFDSSDEGGYLARDLFTPGILNLGAFEGVAALAAPNPLQLFNTGGVFSTSHLEQAYLTAGREDRFHVEEGPVSSAALDSWLARLGDD